MLRLLIATALLGAAAVSLPAQVRNGFGGADWCDESRNRRPAHCEIREETLPATSALEVDARTNGGIRVRGWDRRDTLVRARVAAVADTSARARALVEAVRIETAGGRIRAEGPDTSSGEYWHVSFELQAPRDARLRLEAHNGGIDIAEFGGSADFRTVNGGLALRNVAGDIRGETRNGGIDVELSGARWEGAGLDLETRNGGISLRIPDGYSAELETGTVNGGLRIDFPVTLQGRLTRNHISTRLGAGGARIRAVTRNGGVSIARR